MGKAPLSLERTKGMLCYLLSLTIVFGIVLYPFGIGFNAVCILAPVYIPYVFLALGA